MRDIYDFPGLNIDELKLFARLESTGLQIIVQSALWEIIQHYKVYLDMPGQFQAHFAIGSSLESTRLP